MEESTEYAGSNRASELKEILLLFDVSTFPEVNVDRISREVTYSLKKKRRKMFLERTI